jgi:hypothetical protein
MQISSINVPAAFNPVKIVITCETLDELRVLWATTNVSITQLNGQAGHHANIKAATDQQTRLINGINTQLFKFIDAALIEAGGKD